MDRVTEDQIKIELTERLRQWLDETDLMLPYLGNQSEEILAAAVLTVLRGIANSETYLREMGLLNDLEANL